MLDKNVYLHPDLKSYFTTNEPLFDQIMALKGECFRHQDGRLTQRIKLGNQYYFIKQHRGVGWKEIFKNLLQGRLPIISAKNEWLAIDKLKSLQVNVPVVVGYGKRGINPARIESFIIMQELAETDSLEVWCRQGSGSPSSFKEKQMLIKEVARIARVLHQNGMNHRDFYICHFLLEHLTKKLYLIDLHRAHIRRLTPERWILKDLAGLLFSCKEIGLTQRDLFRFMINYRGKSLREILNMEETFWQKVKTRGHTYLDHTLPGR